MVPIANSAAVRLRGIGAQTQAGLRNVPGIVQMRGRCKRFPQQIVVFTQRRRVTG